MEMLEILKEVLTLTESLNQLKEDVSKLVGKIEIYAERIIKLETQFDFYESFMRASMGAEL